MEKTTLTDQETEVLTENRRKLLKALSSRASSTSNLKILGSNSWHVIRYHLRILENFGFITSKKEEIPTVQGNKKKTTTMYYITAKGYSGLQKFYE